jgi:hypothetical protein
MNKLIEAGTIVEYKICTGINGYLEGEGVIVGLSHNDIPVLGQGYMVKDLSGNVPNSTYEYDTFSVSAVHLKLTKEGLTCLK